ncbi:aldose 1-epimerase [Novosphingobium sp.]|uniref:aldose 1-epimerase n=1 Tax=Novosphingobium sp. TaxID=1874826 RepID=UPI0026213A61|nr:aldose 1-epimerase [Novosphingobium sp.]
MQLAIAAGDYRLVAAPARGGSILSFTWRGEPVMREAEGPDILDVGCFVMVPFANRIKDGRFVWRGRPMIIPPNLEGRDRLNPIHGYGWQAEWAVVETAPERLRFGHRHAGEGWPWPYRADLAYALDTGGLTARLTLTNTGDEAMPAGLGFHPYFPRSATTRYIGLHRGEWQTGRDPLPVALERRTTAIDWWEGSPVGTREVDTVYSGREGPLEILWPERAMALTITPSPALALTAVYAPAGTGWFCAEPMNHLTDAVNGRDPAAAMPALEPGETAVVEMHLGVRPL